MVGRGDSVDPQQAEGTPWTPGRQLGIRGPKTDNGESVDPRQAEETPWTRGRQRGLWTAKPVCLHRSNLLSMAEH